MKPHSPLCFALTAFTLSFAPSSAVAQDSPPPASDSQVVQLSPFSIQVSKDAGYIANDTVAGGRLTTNLLQTPNDVTVLTRDFLNDINALSLNDAAVWLTNSNVTLATDNRDFGHNVSFRGLTSGENTRDYFIYPQSIEEYIIDRIEGARGANSIIYGDGGSGGQLNVITKRALFTSFERIEGRVDTWGTTRATVDLNTALGNKLAVRVNAMAEDRRSWVDGYYDKRYAADLAATYQPWQGTQIRFEGELGYAKTAAYGYVYSDTSSLWDRSSATNGPITVNPAASTGLVRFSADQLVISNDFAGTQNFKNYARTTGTFLNISDRPYPFANFPVLPDKSFRITPPDSNLGTHFANAAVFLEQKLPLNGVLEIAASTNGVLRNGTSAEGNNTYIDVNRLLPSGAANPNFGKIYSQSTIAVNVTPNYTNNYRVAVAFPWITRWFSQTFSSVVQRREGFFEPQSYAFARTKDPTNAAISGSLRNASNAVYVWRYWDNPGAPLTLPQSTGGYQFAQYITRDQSQYDALNSIQFNTIGNYFNDAVTFVAGVRFDRYNVDGRTGLFDANGFPSGNANNVTYASARTNSIGLTYFPVHPIGVYANYSEGFSPQGDNNPWILSPQYTTHSRDRSAGLRFRAFRDRLVGSVGYYNSHEGGVLTGISGLRTDINNIWIGLNQGDRTIAGPFSVADDSLDVNARGWEADITANVTSHFKLKANYALPKTSQDNAYPQIRQYYAANIAQWQAGANDPTNANAVTIKTNIANIQNLISAGADGRTLNATYQYRANIFGVYTFDQGWLKNLRAGGGVNLFGNQLIGNPTGQPYNYIYDPSYYVVTGTLGYSFKWRATPVDLTLTISNLLGFDRPVFSAVTVFNGVAYPNAYTYVPPTTGTLAAKFRF